MQPASDGSAETTRTLQSQGARIQKSPRRWVLSWGQKLRACFRAAGSRSARLVCRSLHAHSRSSWCLLCFFQRHAIDATRRLLKTRTLGPRCVSAMQLANYFARAAACLETVGMNPPHAQEPARPQQLQLAPALLPPEARHQGHEASSEAAHAWPRRLALAGHGAAGIRCTPCPAPPPAPRRSACTAEPHVDQQTGHSARVCSAAKGHSSLLLLAVALQVLTVRPVQTLLQLLVVLPVQQIAFSPRQLASTGKLGRSGLLSLAVALQALAVRPVQTLLQLLVITHA